MEEVKKQEYYTLDKLIQKDCEYNIILGERSNGKSYAVKHLAVSDSYRDDKQKFVLLRRFDLDIKGALIEQYFADVPVKEITNDEYESITYFRGDLYLSKYDIEKDKIVKGKKIGYVRALSQSERYKSGSYIDVSKVIYEEFISDKHYLPNEPRQLQQLVSTIARRRRINVYMVGNTISRLCPYFLEWKLRNLPNQEQGTIEVYNHKTNQFSENGKQVIIKIAVEYTENSGNNTQMAFGDVGESITSGVWEYDQKPLLSKRLGLHLNMYTILIKYMAFEWIARFLYDPDTEGTFWYVEPKQENETYDKDIRVISDVPDMRVTHTVGFIPLSKNESVAFSYFKMSKVVYSDNLTGSEFEVVIKSLS